MWRACLNPTIAKFWQDPLMMTTTRLACALTLCVAIVRPATAQSIIFETTLANALRRATVQPRIGGVRERATNRRCDGCEDRPGTTHLVADSVLLTDAWLAAHDYRGSDREANDGTA